MRTIVIAGGGTGGHLYPGLALAERLRSQGARVWFVGSRRGLDSRVVPGHGFPLVCVRAAPLSSRPVEAAGAFLNAALGFFQSLWHLLWLRPDLVVGTGGYASAPVVLAAAVLGVPRLLLEQNARPGRTTRWLARWAHRICLSFPQAAGSLPADRTVVTGNPLRPGVLAGRRESARRTLDLPARGFCLLVTGGSQGARSLNRALLAALPRWRDRDWGVLHLTGREHYEEVRRTAERLVAGTKLIYRCLDYTERMAEAYAAADLVVCRAGATTLAELTARGLPAVLVPYPHAADGHQEANAEALAAAGAARVIPDDRVEESLAGVVREVADWPEGLRKMSRAASRLGRPDACERVLEIAEELMTGVPEEDRP